MSLFIGFYRWEVPSFIDRNRDLLCSGYFKIEQQVTDLCAQYYSHQLYTIQDLKNPPKINDNYEREPYFCSPPFELNLYIWHLLIMIKQDSQDFVVIFRVRYRRWTFTR